MFLVIFWFKTIINCGISGDDIVDLSGEDEDDEDSYEDVFEDENEDTQDFIA